ncbi:hypothetical protein CSHISOI_08462 [Colletotrichum shisoi]|uniref:Uncharacterized protein n=1 Tax=Colletotrichum shisoi TaxID=2078593 RepID=A0A5Q4BJ67_9PEZI|nr:hypothetical protein CSHISOI_08462 [Colletotrichum shisoi]
MPSMVIPPPLSPIHQTSTAGHPQPGPSLLPVWRAARTTDGTLDGATRAS